MGNFSRDTFDRLKHYVGVRLQQGVPIVDADWNELEDIRKHELQRFLKWFVGNGVPQGNDGFRILPQSDGTENDFIIKGGENGQPGCCLVEGREVKIGQDVHYMGQQLYQDETLAARWGVAALQPLSPAPLKGDRTDTVYLDVWEREVDAVEDDDLINQAIGIETCVRVKREWVVRVAEGETEPPAAPRGHVYYPIAQLTRADGVNTIPEKDIKDLRQTGLTLQHTAGTISSLSPVENVTTAHTRQVNASHTSTAAGVYYSQVNTSCNCTASGKHSQVNASHTSTASGEYQSQVNASYTSTASGTRSQVNASRGSTAGNEMSQVNSSYNSTATGVHSQVNASYNSTASGVYSQVNASNISTASGENHSQVNASYKSAASSDHSQINASYNSTASGGNHSQVNASEGCTASGTRSQVNASLRSTAENNMSQVNACSECTASGIYQSQVNASYKSTASSAYSQVNASRSSHANGKNQSQVNVSEGSTASGTRCQVNASRGSTAENDMSQVNASAESHALGNRSQVNASGSAQTKGQYSMVNASDFCTASGYRSQVNASTGSSAIGANSMVNASALSNAHHDFSQVSASARVEHKNCFSLCGGYAPEGEPSLANRKWLIYSQTGEMLLAGNVHGGQFADYGEYFENLKKGEIKIGTLIALEGAKVRPAKKDEDLIGVVSGTAAIRLGDSPFCWQGRYVYDEWGRPVHEEIKDPDWQPREDQTEKDRPTIRVQKENPDYDIQKEQIPRSDRPNEWTLVGLLGQVYVRCDDTVKPGDFIKSKGRGIATGSPEKTKLKAMKVTRPFNGKYAIVYCLLN